MTQRLRVGVVGAGVIAQVMHLHYLRELAGHFEVAALCDIAPENVEANAASHHIPRVFTEWREMIREPIDAVLILTSGNHAPIAVAAAQAGKHVLVEKPMCLSVDEGKQMRDAAARLLPDFRPGPLVVRGGVRQVVVLVGLPRAGNLLRQP